MTVSSAAPGEPGRWTLVTAPRIYTMAGPPAEAMVLYDGRVILTGTARELTDRFDVQERVELSGFVFPGFNDAHAHPTMTADNLLRVDCSPEIALDESTLCDLLRAETDRLEPGAWVIGSRYDHTKTTGGRVFDRWALDAVVGDRPALLIHVAAHWGVVSSAGLAAAGLDDSSTDPKGGALGRDGQGHLNGLVYEQALFDLAYPSLARGETVVPQPSPQMRLRSLRRAQDMFHAAGLTSMCDALCGPADLALLTSAREAGELTMRTSALLAYPHYGHVANLGLHGSIGDERLRLLGVKAFVDGACAGGNCLVEEPFEGTDDHGMQVIDTDELTGLVGQVAADGIVIGVHANGDRAIRLLLDAHELARRQGAPLRRHRIEHCTLVDDDIVRRIRDLGLVAVPFGSYARFHGDKLAGYYGEERLERMFAHRTLLDAGVAVAGSSDFPCGPFEPLAAVASCVSRQALDGRLVGPSQRISPLEAIALYTTGSAYASGEEHLKGRLAPGQLADFVELGADPLEVPADEIAGIEVRSTWVGGKPVFDATSRSRTRQERPA